MPITWKNVNSGGTGDALAALTAAGKSINAGIGNFGSIVDERAAIEDENFATQGTMNTQAFKDKLATYQTPEALLAARASGEIDAFGKSLGANIDRNVLRDGFDTQLSDVRNKQTDAYNYDQSILNRVDDTYNREQRLLDQEAAPLVERIRSSMINGTDADTTAMINADSDLLARSGNLATIQKEYDERNRTELDRKNSDEEFDYNKSARDQTDKANDLLTEVVANSGSGAEARARFSAQAAELGIDPRYTTPFLEQADARFQGQFGLTKEQGEDLNAYSQSLAVMAEGETAKAAQDLAVVKAEKPVNPNFVPDKVFETTLGSVGEYMRGTLEIEDTGAPSDVQKAITAAIADRFPDSVDKYRPAIPAIALESVKRIGAEKPWLLTEIFSLGLATRDLNAWNSELTSEISRVIDEYVASEDNRLEVEKATKNYQDRINEIKVGTDGAATGFRENLRNFNKSFAR